MHAHYWSWWHTGYSRKTEIKMIVCSLFLSILCCFSQRMFGRNLQKGSLLIAFVFLWLWSVLCPGDTGSGPSSRHASVERGMDRERQSDTSDSETTDIRRLNQQPSGREGRYDPNRWAQRATLFPMKRGGQMAEQLGNRATNQKVAGSILARAKWRCVLGQGTSFYLHGGMSLYLL